MIDTSNVLQHPGTLIGMVHLGALPATPFQSESLNAVIDTAVSEARQLADAGFECLLLENMGDRPYELRNVGPHIIAAMTRAALAIRAEVPELPLGVQILAGANHAALAVAHATGARFIRAEGFAYASVADEGLIADADAASLLRYRRAIGADSVAVFCDVKKKHSAHAISSDLSVGEVVDGSLFCGADGLVITGTSTGAPTSISDLRAAKEAAAGAPILVGSGVTPEQAGELVQVARGLIVGSYIKQDGRWERPVDPARAAELCRAVRAAR